MAGDRVDSTHKTLRLTLNHYNFNTVNQINVLGATTGSGFNKVHIGGNDASWGETAATEIKFYTGANATATNGTERLRIASDGNIDVKGGNIDFEQQNNGVNAVNGSLIFSNAGTSQVSRITGYTGSSADDGDIRFYTKNSGTETEAVRISQHATPKLQFLAGESEIIPSASDGSLTLKSDPGQNRSGSHIAFDVDATERARITSDGLCLGGTGAANAISDYEEGTWTPVASRYTGTTTVSYTTQTGKYTKVGNVVYVQFYITIASVSAQGSSLTFIGGLPFGPDGAYQNSGNLFFNQGLQHDDEADATFFITAHNDGGGRIYFKKELTADDTLSTKDWQAGAVTGGLWYRV